MVKPKLAYLLSFFVLIIVVSACKKNDVLSRDKMVEVLRDIQLAEAVASTRHDDFRLKEQKEALMQGVLKKHNITQAQLDSSLVWYSDNVEVYNRVNDSVVASLRREHDLLTKRIPLRMRPRKVINRGVLPGFYYMNDANPILTFNIDSFQISNYPDLKFDFKTLWTTDSSKASMSVTFLYRDTMLFNTFNLDKDTLYTIQKPDITDTLRMVSGYFSLDSKEALHQNILLYNITLRDSVKVDSVDVELPQLSEIDIEKADTIDN